MGGKPGHGQGHRVIRAPDRRPGVAVLNNFASWWLAVSWSGYCAGAAVSAFQGGFKSFDGRGRGGFLEQALEDRLIFLSVHDRGERRWNPAEARLENLDNGLSISAQGGLLVALFLPPFLAPFLASFLAYLLASLLAYSFDACYLWHLHRILMLDHRSLGGRTPFAFFS